MPARRNNRKVGQAILTNFQKAKVTFVGEQIVVTAFEMWIILDLSYNYVSVSQSQK